MFHFCFCILTASPYCLNINFMFILNVKFKYAKITSRENGKVKKGVVFATYSSLIGESQSAGKYKSRFKQLMHWLGKDFDGLVNVHLLKFCQNTITL